LMGQRTAAQNQAATVPTVVAQATSLERQLYGLPKYFDGRTPPAWPPDLVPSGASIIGGGVLEVPGKTRIQTAVFAFTGDAKPSDVLDALLAKAGYVRHNTLPPRSAALGGFVGMGAPAYSGPQYCNASTWVGFEVVDSAQSPLVVGVRVIDGDAARQTCTALRSTGQIPPPRFGVKVPPLTPPHGVVGYGSGSSWSASTGTTQVTLRTTMTADSLVYHYTSQLVAGGWKAEGKPALTDGVAVQNFSFRDGQDTWSAALIVQAAGDLRRVMLELMKVE
jgi:hypothetical protein